MCALIATFEQGAAGIGDQGPLTYTQLTSALRYISNQTVVSPQTVAREVGITNRSLNRHEIDQLLQWFPLLLVKRTNSVLINAGEALLDGYVLSLLLELDDSSRDLDEVRHVNCCCAIDHRLCCILDWCRRVFNAGRPNKHRSQRHEHRN
jgi:hypothetical protein